VVFSAAKDRAASEQDLLEELFKVLGYAYGAELRGALGQVFWADLAQGGATPLGDPDQDNWGSREWRDFYISVAMIFMRNHIRGND